MFATCKTFQTHLSANGFALVAGKCQTVFIRNASPFADSGSLKLKLGTPLPFTSFAYDPQGPLLLTGDASDYSFDSGVRVWDRNGKMVKQLTESQLHKSVRTVHLSVPDNRASCVGSEGRVRMWNLETGETLCDFPVNNEGCLYPNLQTMTMVSSWRNRSYFWKIEESGEYRRYQLKQDHAGHVSMYEAPKINRIFGHSISEGVFYVWDRTTLELLDSSYRAGTVAYDAPSQQLFCTVGSKIEVLDATTGKQTSVLQHATVNRDHDPAFHYDCTSRWLFAAFNCDLQREVLGVRSGVFGSMRNEIVRERKGKIVVWDLATSKVLFTFPSMPFGIRQIDFDPKTKTLLLADGNSVQLWDFASRRRIREFAGMHTEFRWDKKNQLIVLFRHYTGVDKEQKPIGGTLSLVDYSSAQPKPESKEGKPESKQESKEQPKKE